MDINEKYLVSGSWGGSCIIWQLPDFKLIDYLEIPSQRNYSSTYGIALYNDYIVCQGNSDIRVWKSNLNNLEHRLQFNFKYLIKEDPKNYISDICINNGFLYRAKYSIVTSFNIETSQIIQEYRFDYPTDYITINDNYLSISGSDEATFLDLQTGERKEFSDNRIGSALFISDNKIISVNRKSTNTIKIWNLNDLKFFKEFK